MSSLDELIHYCNEPDPVGALMLTGEWGCGKTYIIEKDLAEALKDTHIIVRVSLFGMNDVGKTNFLYALRFVFDKDVRRQNFSDTDYYKKNTNTPIEILI